MDPSKDLAGNGYGSVAWATGWSAGRRTRSACSTPGAWAVVIGKVTMQICCFDLSIIKLYSCYPLIVYQEGIIVRDKQVLQQQGVALAWKLICICINQLKWI
ncbi:hypothetical protein PVAP13_9KG417900 [Panicum virgatum]|uniref:Uncharacterized protein n=1 Tax=Panicum virgatum TaxID=38727 RepID=A0A8T0NK93_PANVG|nr:hypothetical protein PVAP13_9KG417900 [Panicum virgatum]